MRSVNKNNSLLMKLLCYSIIFGKIVIEKNEEKETK